MSTSTSPWGLRAHRDSHRRAMQQFTGSLRDKYDAAKAAVSAFDAMGIDACVFGSLACKLLGVSCRPNDVDMIVLDEQEAPQEEHKCYLIRSNRQFYSVPSRNPGATYRVLWYCTMRGSRVKVDILQPGTMSILYFSPTDISWLGHRPSIPVAPFGVVLLIKLQGWDDHRQSDEARYFDKQFSDVDHIQDLLDRIPEAVYFDDLPDEFMDRAQERVFEFTQEFPNTKTSWKQLGFQVRNRRR